MLDDDISKAIRNICLTYNKNENKHLGMNGLKKEKKFKTHKEHLIKYLNQCFQRGFSKNLEISRKGEWASPDPLFSKVLPEKLLVKFRRKLWQL